MHFSMPTRPGNDVRYMFRVHIPYRPYVDKGLNRNNCAGMVSNPKDGLLITICNS